MKTREQFCRGFVKSSFVLSALEHVRVKVVAEILDQYEAPGSIKGIDLGCTQSQLPEVVGSGNEAIAIGAGQPGNRIVAEFSPVF